VIYKLYERKLEICSEEETINLVRLLPRHQGYT
jgi:hypothetical protein